MIEKLQEVIAGEQGRSSLPLVAILSLSGLVGIYLSQQSSKQQQALQKARMEISNQNLDDELRNALASFKSLMSNRKIATDQYEPTLFAEDYFASKWSLQKNTLAKTSGITSSNSGSKVTIETLKALTSASSEDLSEIYEGSKSVAETAKETVDIEIIKVVFDDSNPYLAKGILVRASTAGAEGEKSAKALVPLTVPEPSDIKLWVKAPGSSTFQQVYGSENSPLPAGDYELMITADGVALDAEISINNGTPIVIGSDVKHDAHNIRADDASIGVIKLKAGGNGELIYEFDHKTCSATPTTASGSNKYNIDVTVYDPSLNIHKPKIGLVNLFVENKAASSKKMSFAELTALCPGKCASTTYTPTAGVVQGGISLSANNYLASKADIEKIVGHSISESGMISTDYYQLAHREYFPTYSYTAFHNQTQKYGIFDAKVCASNSRGLAKSLADHNYDVQKAYDKIVNTGNYYKTIQRIYYQEPSCKPRLLFNRNSCGCFAENTEILLGDQKSLLRIQDIQQGDLVWNPKTKAAAKVARVIVGPEKFPLIRITLSNQQALRITGKHPFPTPSGIKAAFQLMAGETVLSNNGNPLRILEVQQESSSQETIVWNLLLEGERLQDHYLVANGVVTGDYFIQQKLESSPGNRIVDRRR
ncbi:Hint domain-containing protein [Pseudobacteriovorax antillogorgiicola]|nr:Hint domain-containing protein [Pseudobacteriovorax antillogorgiicola]